MVCLIATQILSASLLLAAATTQATSVGDGVGDGIIVEFLFPELPTFIGEDTSGNGADATVVHPSFYHTGPIQDSNSDSRDCAQVDFVGFLYFGGFNGVHNLLPTGAEPRTVCAWVLPTEAFPGIPFSYNRTVVGFGQDPDNDLELLLEANGEILIDAGLDSNTFIAVDSPPVPLNKWSFVCLAAEDDQYDVYVGDTNTPVDLKMYSSVQPHDVAMFFASIGADPFNGDLNPFTGYVDDVRLWNRVLSYDEVEHMRTFSGSVQGLYNTRCPAGYSRTGSFCYWTRDKIVPPVGTDPIPPRGTEICTVMGGEVSHDYVQFGPLTCMTNPVPADQLADRIVESAHPYANSEYFQRVVSLPDTNCYKVWFSSPSKTKNFSDQVRIYRRNWGKHTEDGAQTALVEPVKYEDTFLTGVGSSYEEAYEIRGNAVVIEFEASRFGYAFGFIANIAACPAL